MKKLLNMHKTWVQTFSLNFIHFSEVMVALDVGGDDVKITHELLSNLDFIFVSSLCLTLYSRIISPFSGTNTV